MGEYGQGLQVERNGTLLDAIGSSEPSTSSITRAVLVGDQLEAVDCGDVRVIQGREDFGSTLKAPGE